MTAIAVPPAIVKPAGLTTVQRKRLLAGLEIPDCGCPFLTECTCPWRCRKCAYEEPRTDEKSKRCPRCPADVHAWMEASCRGILYHLIRPACVHVLARDFQRCRAWRCPRCPWAGPRTEDEDCPVCGHWSRPCGWVPERAIVDPDTDSIRIEAWPDVDIEALEGCPRCGLRQRFQSLAQWAWQLRAVYQADYLEPPLPLTPLRRLNDKKRIAGMAERYRDGFALYLPGADWHSGNERVDEQLDVLGIHLEMAGNWRAILGGYRVLAGPLPEPDDDQAEEERLADLFAWKETWGGNR